MTEPDYDPQADISGSFELALQKKRERGDKHYRVESPIKREVVMGDCRLLLGDCREILPILGRGRFDLCLTDPPYGMKRDGKPKSTSSHGGHKGYDFKGWDASAPSAEVFAAIRAASVDQIIWGANFFPQYLPPSMGWLFWDKGQRIDQSDGELAFTSRPKALRVFTLNRAAIASDGAVHPTQKPVRLMKWCLGLVPNTRTVIDPFAGSGTTLVACAELGVKATGIEIDEGYFDIACARIRKAYDEPDMFVERPPEPIQQPLFGEVTE